ncbi:MAG: IMP dehydrogenase [Candidatus Lloydbacteria bacterium CG22_combo_CG10-13_8_21_14_all_47_15]|uniref:IMP dehydrogenase n=1 Tax=Candidatus Lloydbacteria bacterium CG22_combo_CG10-13_8_21_14_all_47_15 TaxID=1974635 RepID=A0A2H0CVN5_9BACT|nr:MAG: IMP dehydrogenase [Candidatus Lloydbacteria bacterium CG22_combo_CG10-13_8_21_14_all_47_15]
MKNRPKDDFFAHLEDEGIGVTFGDVQLKTKYSTVRPPDVSLVSRFSRRVPLKVPFVSAAMDTVTEYPMAIAMAKAGGIGIIHRAMSPKEQARHVTRVKRYMNPFIPDPICVFETDTVESVLRMKEEKEYDFDTFLVLNAHGKLSGVLTSRNFKHCLENEVYLTVGTVMARDDLVTAHPDTSFEEAFQLMRKCPGDGIGLLPLVDESGMVAGLYTWKDIKRRKSSETEAYNTDTDGRLIVGAAIGIGDAGLAQAELLVLEDVDVLVIDAAHGDTETIVDMVRVVKKEFPDVDVVAGNISEADAVIRLIQAGVDGIKVGQGGGSICTTRTVAGIGCPQVSAVALCERAIRYTHKDIPVCSDGGVTESGHAAIALAAGASSVMMGRIFAGANEAPGDIIIYPDGQRFKRYDGMGSQSAMERSSAARERYGGNGSGKTVPEGVEAIVPCQGPVANVISRFIGGVRSSMGYLGAETISAFQMRAEFRRVTEAGRREASPHDVTVIPFSPISK